MHIPAKAVFEQLLSERAAILFAPEEGDYPYTIIIKLPQPLIKEIQRGCLTRLGLFIYNQGDKRVLISFLEIFDDHTLPMVVSFPQCRSEYHQALQGILNRNVAPVFFYDESTRLTAETIGHFKNPENALRMLGDIGKLFTGTEDADVNKALDVLHEQLESRVTPLTDIDGITLMTIGFNEFHNPKIIAIGLKQSFSFSIADSDEGAPQEVSVWHKLETMFLGNIYRSAFWLDNGIQKELTDIFAFTEAGIFIIESKAVSVFNKKANRTTQRREYDILKDIKKGLKQVAGAARRIAAGTPIYYESTYSKNKIELTFDRSITAHAIILVSDISLIFNERETITEEVIKQSKCHRIFIQILDLTELNYIATRIMDRHNFDRYLVSRFQSTLQNKNAFVRMDII